MDEECESAIGQLAISSQFGREAARILKKPFHSQWRIVLYAPVLSPLFFVQIRVALRVNRGRWRAKGHRSQRHPLRYSSTGCLVSLLFPNEEAVVEGELSPARVRRAVSAGRPPLSSAEERSRHRGAECSKNWWMFRDVGAPALGTLGLGSSVCPPRVSCSATHFRRRFSAVHAFFSKLSLFPSTDEDFKDRKSVV